MNLTKIIYDGQEKEQFRFKFLWSVNGGDELTDNHFLLYKVLDDSELDPPPQLSPETPGVKTAMIFAPGSTAEKAGARKLNIPADSICAFAVCPETKNGPGKASNTRLSYAGERKKVRWSLESANDGCTKLTISAECELGLDELLLKIGGRECLLPFNVGRQKQSALFFAQISRGQVEPILRGKALYKCILEYGHE